MDGRKRDNMTKYMLILPLVLAGCMTTPNNQTPEQRKQSEKQLRYGLCLLEGHGYSACHNYAITNIKPTKMECTHFGSTTTCRER